MIINGARSDNNAVMLNRGIHQVLDPRIASGKIPARGRRSGPRAWDSDKARAAMEAVVAKDRNIDAVIAGNDMLAEAVIRVLSENRLMGKVKVAGQDADLAACQRIAEGSQYATDLQTHRSAGPQGGRASPSCWRRGNPSPRTPPSTTAPGKVPYVRLEPILVTKELLNATVIKDGFHSEVDVYRNVKQ